MQAVKQEILYCDKYVTQSRRKLLEEFEKWYKAAFLGDDESKFEVCTAHNITVSIINMYMKMIGEKCSWRTYYITVDPATLYNKYKNH